MADPLSVLVDAVQTWQKKRSAPVFAEDGKHPWEILHEIDVQIAQKGDKVKDYFIKS